MESTLALESLRKKLFLMRNLGMSDGLSCWKSTKSLLWNKIYTIYSPYCASLPHGAFYANFLNDGNILVSFRRI